MPAWLAPAIMAAGGIASSLMSRGGSSPDVAPWDQYKMSYEWDRARTIERPGWLAEGARRAGYHPLAVLGMNAGSGPQIYHGTPGSGGRGMGRAVEYAARGMAQITSDYNKERVRGAKLDNDIKEMTLENMGQSPMTPRGPFGIMQREQEYIQGQPGPNPLYVRQPVVTSKALGLQEATVPEERHVVDQYGYVKETLSQPIQEAAESDWYFNIKRLLTKGAQYGMTLWRGHFRPSRIEFGRLVRNINERKAKLDPLPSHLEYRFDITRNEFKISKRGRYPRMFTNTRAEEYYRRMKRR